MGMIRTGKITVNGVDTTTMVTADALGTKTTVTVPEKGAIETLLLTDLAAQDAKIELLLFNADITTGDNGTAYDMADADAPKFLGHIPVTAADYSSLADNSVAVVPNVGLAYECYGGVITFQCVVRGTPTYAVDAIVVEFVIWTP